MAGRWKTALWIFLYSFLIGALLTAFSFTTSIIKYVFSLLALYLIIRFFRRYETWPARILFIVQSIVMFFFGTIVVAMVLYIQSGGVTAP